jgi:hypothetical protein
VASHTLSIFVNVATTLKIHADKIENGPAHAFTVRDVKAILKAVPSQWIEGLTEVRLSNGIVDHYRPYAFFSGYDGCLTIYSRQGTKREALMAVLAALAVRPLEIRLSFKCHPSEADRRRIERLVQPIFNELMAKSAF